MSHLQDTWIKCTDLSQILMSLLKLKLRPLYDITINLSMTGSTAVTQAQILRFPIYSPPGYDCKELRRVYQTGVTLPSSQPLHGDRRHIITSSVKWFVVCFAYKGF